MSARGTGSDNKTVGSMDARWLVANVAGADFGPVYFFERTDHFTDV